MTDRTLPLAGLMVLEFTHAVMGPSAGVILADLGADVIHVEPPEGDSTRRLRGMGTGFFGFFNRNKQSLAVDLKHPDGLALIEQLLATTDILLENFGPGTMDRLGLGYDALSARWPRLIYCALKGFLPGPYEQRHAMDEVVQMMGGLAYMTGPPGMPLRAGTSVVDITGGMFGVTGVLAALHERHTTGRGQLVQAALFETTAFLMGQHMAHGALSRQPVPPMPARISPWSVYRTFQPADGDPVFIGLVSDKHWQRFCAAFDRPDLAQDAALATNNARIDQRDRLLPELERLIAALSRDEVIARCERADIPFAPIARTEDLFDDPQLNGGAGLLETQLDPTTRARMPRTPLILDGRPLPLRNDPPAIGADSWAIARRMGLTDAAIAARIAAGVLAAPDAAPSTPDATGSS
jgi:crotonobetainyl-CoA:carnitine CoA-transferase CaiB-like acyl-CoA transferase